jgi:hypothetical protein
MHLPLKLGEDGGRGEQWRKRERSGEEQLLGELREGAQKQEEEERENWVQSDIAMLTSYPASSRARRCGRAST